MRVGRRGAPEMQIRNTAGGRGVPLCYLDRKSVFRFTVMPGSYVVSSRSDRGDGLQEISLEAEAGTTYYITVGRQRCRCTGNPAPSVSSRWCGLKAMAQLQGPESEYTLTASGSGPPDVAAEPGGGSPGPPGGHEPPLELVVSFG